MSKEIEELMKQVLGNGKAARRGLNHPAGSAPRTKAEEEAAAMETSMGQLLRQQQAQLQELESRQTKRANAANSAGQKAKRELEAMEAMGDRLNQRLQEQLEEMKRMSRELDLDLPAESTAEAAESSAPLQPVQEQAAECSPTPADRMAVAKAIGEAAKQAEDALPGQEAFLKQLGIAFKRPYVTGWDSPNGARSTILVRGSRGSGRHLALRKMSEALQGAGVPGTLVEMDLSLYPSNSQERLFLQDLYSALESGGVVVFDNFDKCHPAYLQQIAKLFTQGKLPLSARYVMQKGHLVEAGTALTKDTVKELTPDGCYLVLVTEGDETDLADAFGAALVNALADRCATEMPDSEALMEIAQDQQEILAQKAKEMLEFALVFPAGFAQQLSLRYTPKAGITGITAFTDKCYKALAQYKLEKDAPACTVTLSLRDEVLFADFGSGSLDLFSLLPAAYQGGLEAVKAEMDNIIGLQKIKEYIFSLEDHYKAQQRRKAEGLKTGGMSMHMIFSGNPGTGKTTIARLVSRYLKAIGVLSGGQLVEVTRADLVGKYVGHTAPLTQQVIESALGGVLFIDEAYSLHRSKDDSFGLEAIDTLVKGMEDNRENLIVILAGYTDEMQVFLEANSGLKSRFPNFIEFPDYTGQELTDIALLTAKGKGYRLTQEAQDALLAYFTRVQAKHLRETGNGRLARNLIEGAILSHSRRIAKDPNASLDLLEKDDFTLTE
jgi:Cdc6-like AAA superfamily ATPase